MKLLREQTCYLCGAPIPRGEETRDHVPPAQIYPAKYRAKDWVKNLKTLTTHSVCNTGYQRDEDYFVHSLSPLAADSPAGREFWNDFALRLRRKENRGLTEKVRREFQESVGGIVLPHGKMLKRIEGKRVGRVIWKIVRGLFFNEYGRFLPEETPRTFSLVDPDYPPPDEFAHVRDTPSRGQHPAFFDYKYLSVKELNNFHYWAFLFWDKLIVTCAFHDPKCPCEKCHQVQEAKANSDV